LLDVAFGLDSGTEAPRPSPTKARKHKKRMVVRKCTVISQNLVYPTGKLVR